MEKNIEAIGATNQLECIATLLGVKDETEYGLYQETDQGKYYAKRLPDGTLDTAKVVRLLSDEQAAELEAELCKMIDGKSSQFSELTQHIPAFDPEKMMVGVIKIADDVAEKIQKSLGKASLFVTTK